MNNAKFYTEEQIQLYNDILDFLEKAYASAGPYEPGDANTDSPVDALVLNFTKVVNDCRAIIYLIQEKFYIQAGIIARSTHDASLLMMHIAFEGEDASFVKKWLNDKYIKHWNLIKTINKYLKRNRQGKLDISGYSKMRKQLDDFVHGNYHALKLYPTQSPGPTKMTEESFRSLSMWKELVHSFLVGCLLVVAYLLVPDLKSTAEEFLDKLGYAVL